MNKPVQPQALRPLPEDLQQRLQAHVDAGRFESVSEAMFVAATALADQLEFGTDDDAEAIRRSIAAAQAEDDYRPAEDVLARLRARTGNA